MNQKSDEIILLDKEWEDLILSALEIGITIDEIKNFFKQFSSPE